MKRVLVALCALNFLLVGCGIQSLTEQMKDQVVETNKTTHDLSDKTSDLVNGMRLQTLTLSLTGLQADANSEALTPPVLMLPYALKFAETATAREIVEIYYALLADAVNGVHDPIGDRPHSRSRDYRAASAIVAMTPDAKFQEIYKTEVDGASRYEGTVYQMAASRYNFIKNYLFMPLIDSDRTPYANEAVVKMAADYFSSMKFLAQSANVKKFKVTVPGVLEDPNLEEPKPGQPKNKLIDSTESVDPADLQSSSDAALSAFAAPRLTPDVLKKDSVKELLKRFAL